jgi:4,5:9,10-diseco-3-hydroxy-5,9,17-trioxoandrosta-1(10),2-diene-4-oate hydrolase
VSTKAVPEGKYADVGDGHRVHYHEAGAGPAVLFLHGSGPGASGWSNFRRNFPYLAERGFRVLVPDTIGYGYSSKPEDIEYHLDVLVDKVERFTKAVGVESCSVIGNSHGGAMSIGLALKRPDLVKKLVLMAPGGLEERETYMKMEGIRVMAKAFMAPEITRESMRKVFGLQLFDPSLVTDEIIEERFEIAQLQPKKVLTSMVVPHLTPRLPELKMPVLGFWGVDDKFCPVSGAMRIAEGCPDARVMLLSRCGHWVMVEHQELFNRMTLDFLKSH